MTTKRFVISAFGSAGDVHPFLAIGKALRARGHEVAVYASAPFADRVRAADIEFVETESEDRYEELIRNPLLWNPTKAFGFLMREAVIPALAGHVGALRAEAAKPGAVLVSSTLDLAGRIVRDADPVRLATVHLAPACLRTLHHLPRFGTASVPDWAPKFVKRFYWWLGDRLFDPDYVPGVNAVRQSLGLGPVSRPLNGWWNSPDLVLAAFPEWFAPRQPDWPEQTRLTGFPLFDAGGDRPLEDDLAEWIDAGEPPIVFTGGSAMVQGHEFFEQAADACRRLGARALFITSEEDSIPADLPEGVLHRPYVPFGALLPRAAALVSHGGVGTAAQALHAGVPHLVMPIAHDQYDNADRVTTLGAGDSLPQPRFTGAAAAEKLKAMLASKEVSEACRTVRDRMRSDDGIAAMVEFLENLG
ncbi:MAG: glycosyltransferase [Planctomycetota bacterium]|jgi:UDP:flavonoid glycosyltransferase YjiC (YdhE family)